MADMKKIEESIFVSRPCEDVFAYLENRSNDSEWMVAVTESRWLDQEPNAPGAAVHLGRKGRMIMNIRGKPAEFVDEVTAYEPGRRIAHRTVEGPFPLNTACICEPAAGGCTATVVGEADRLVDGPLRPLIEPIIAWSIRRGFKADLARLKHILESPVRP
jgi:uncharacterized membrane protein